MYLNVYQFSLDLAGCIRTTTDTKKPAGLVPCGLSVLHRTYPDHDLVELVDDGRLAGHADLDALRQLHPQLHTFAGWLAGPGRPAFERALTSGARWAFDR